MNAILKKVRKVWLPPVFKSEEETRVGKIIHILSLGMLVGIMLPIANNASSSDLHAVYILTFAELCILVTLWLNYHGRLKWATHLLAFTLLVTATALIWATGEGIHDVAIMVYPGVLLVAGLLFDKRSFIGFVIVVLLCVTAIVMAEISGVLVTRYGSYTTLHNLLDMVVILVLTAIGIGLLVGNLRDSLIKSRRQETRLAAANVELERQAMQLRESEENYREIFNATNDAVFVHDAKTGKILDVNRTMLEMYRYSRDEIAKLSLDDLCLGKSPHSHKEAIQLIRKAVAEGPQVFEWRCRRKDSQLFWAEIGLRSTHIGGEGRVLATVRDITERKQAEDQLQLLEEELRQMQKMEAIGRLAGGVAHDFNNILTTMFGYTQMLQTDGNLNPPAQQHVAELKKSAERAANLTRQLLMFSRRQAMQLTNLDLNEVVANMTKMLQRLIGEHISLEAHFYPGVAPVHADLGMMEQVLMNLAVNSRDAMPKGGNLILRTTIVDFGAEPATAHRKARSGRFVHLSIGDTGCGIAPEHLPHIFEPFFTTKDVGKGTGLGLATVFGIIEQHNGWIDVESRVGAGTTFHIYLPLLLDHSTVSFETEVIPQVRGGNETLLLVEDEASVRTLTKDALERKGYRVHEASDGAEAIKVWRQHRDTIDLLVTDLVMPGGISGRELAERLLAEKPDLRIVYCSGYSEETLGEDFKPQRHQFLQKPYDLTRLTKLVRDRLDASASSVHAKL